jgi:outer membrane protein
MKEYILKTLKQNIKHSLKKRRRQLEAEIKRSNKMLLTFKVKRRQTVNLGTTKGAELQKRQQLSYAQQALSQQLQQEEWNGHFSK